MFSLPEGGGVHLCLCSASRKGEGLTYRWWFLRVELPLLDLSFFHGSCVMPICKHHADLFAFILHSDAGRSFSLQFLIGLLL